MSSPNPGVLRLKQIASSGATPPPGYAIIYSKTDNVLYLKDSTGTEVALGSASAITQLVGEASGSGPGVTTVTLSNSAVIGKVLSGFTPGPNSTVLSTDTILQAIQKLQAQANSVAATNLAGDVTGPFNTTVVTTVGGKTASAIAQSVTDTQAATSINTASTLVKRDASGNFAANIISAQLNGNASTATSAISFTGPLLGDVTGTQGATTIADTVVTSKLLTGYVPGPNSGILSTDSILLAFGKIQTQVNTTMAAAITNLTGDVTANGPGSVSSTVNSVGGSSAANLHLAELAANAATALNTASTIVKRDPSGNFAAGLITASFSGPLTGNVTGNVSGSAASFTGNLSGDVSGPQNTTLVNTVGGSTAANIHSAELAANAATDANTPSTIVKRDASGNFVATLITANLNGNVSGSSASFTGSLSGDVTGTQSTTAISDTTVTGKLLTGYVSSPGTVSATDSILTAIEKINGNVSAISAGAITNLTGDVVANGPGSVGSLIQSNVVTNAKLSQMPTNTLKGNNTGGTANAADLTVAQVTALLNNNTAPVQIGTSNNAGSSNFLPRADHVHAHGAQTDPTLHALVTISANGFMSATDKVKLNTISSVPGTNAQILISDGTNLNPQSVSGDITITNAGVVAVNTVTGTIPVTKGGTGQTSYTDGQLLIGNSTGNTLAKASLTAGTGISITPGAGSITISSSGSTATTTKTANYTILSSDSTIFVNSTSGPFTLTLPSPTGIAGKIFRIIGTSGTMQTNPVTLAPSGAEKIEGLAASKVLQTNWGWFQVTTDGTDWYVG